MLPYVSSLWKAFQNLNESKSLAAVSYVYKSYTSRETLGEML